MPKAKQLFSDRFGHSVVPRIDSFLIINRLFPDHLLVI